MKCIADIKLELMDRIEDAKFEISLWKQVKILKKKKDGTDFANRVKSFENAKWTIPTFSDEFHPELIVSGYDSKGKFRDYCIFAYLYCDDMSASDARKELGKQTASYMRPTYVLTPDEVYIAIKDRIASLERSITILEAEFNDVDDVYFRFFNAVESAFKTLNEDCKQYRNDEKYPSSLEYAIAKVLGNRTNSLLRGQ